VPYLTSEKRTHNIIGRYRKLFSLYPYYKFTIGLYTVRLIQQQAFKEQATAKGKNWKFLIVSGFDSAYEC